ncbi:hypothetical protein ACFE04_021277 [Oxalis oulophora]
MGIRLIFNSLKHRVPQSLSLIQSRIGQSRRIQFSSYRNYSKPRNGEKKIMQTVKSAETEAGGPSWNWTSFTIPGAGLLGFVGLAGFIHYNDERRIILKGQNSIGVDTVKGPIIGGPFTLIDTENRTLTEKDFLGNWVLLYFGYTSSPDVGPAQIQMIAKAEESVHNLTVLPVFVTLDPQRDSPAQLRAYLKEFSPKLVGLTGPVGSVRQMAQEYRVYFRKVEEEGGDYLVEASHNMYLMNPKMEVARCFGVEYNADELSEAILKETRKNPTPT